MQPCWLSGKQAQRWLSVLLTIILLAAWVLQDYRQVRNRWHARQSAHQEACLRERTPKVALLFLIRSGFPLQGTWAAWLQAAQGIVPATAACDISCRHPQHPSSVVQPYPWRWAWLLQTAGKGSSWDALLSQGLAVEPQPDVADSGVLERQYMFSMYLHSSPNLKPELGMPGSWLDGREISARVPTAWAHHNCTVAFKLLLAEALTDHMNQVFVFLSDSDAPLYPPSLVYLQLLAEQPRSRVDTCIHPNATDPQHNDLRWSPDMETKAFKQSHWRKSYQWVTLSRRHAVLVASDTHVANLFERHCVIGYDVKLNRERDCMADEHYVPSLLVSLGEADLCSCDCVTYTNWSQGGPHPATYRAENLTQAVLQAMRRAYWNCSATAVHDAAAALMLHKSQLSSAVCKDVDMFSTGSKGIASHVTAGQNGPAPPSPALELQRALNAVYQAETLLRCPLFARKFDAAVDDQLRWLLTPCYSSGQPDASC